MSLLVAAVVIVLADLAVAGLALGLIAIRWAERDPRPRRQAGPLAPQPTAPIVSRTEYKLRGDDPDLVALFNGRRQT